MRRRLGIQFFLVWLTMWSVCHGRAEAPRPPRPATRSELQQLLRRSLEATAAPGSHWGVKAVSLQTGRILFETNATQLFVPASNTKLFTAALALDRLRPERRLNTTLFVPAGTVGDTVTGDLLVVGGGDPTISDRLNGGSWEAAFAPLVAAVTKAGIRKIAGDLVCDASLFRGPPYGSGWNWDDLGYYYGAPVSALSANDNVLHLRVTPGGKIGAPATVQVLPLTGLVDLVPQIRTGPTNASADLQIERLPGESRATVRGVVPFRGAVQTEEVTVPSPPRYFGELLRLALQRTGVTVAGKVREVGWRERAERPRLAAEWRELAAVPSPTLGEIVRAMMKPSQNFYAQSLWLLAGVEAERLPVGNEVGLALPATTEASGVRALQTFLGRAGIASQEVALEEGSGLSRKNLVTPSATVQLLVHMQRHPARTAWLDSLPVGGVDGTLKGRFTSPALKGRVRGKTGTLRHVSGLSGYVDTAAGETVAFSIYVNGYAPTRPSASAPAESDRLVELLASFTGKSDAE